MSSKTFIPLHHLAQRLGLPAAWLRAEAEAGRIPSLHANRRLLFNPETVEAVLLARAQPVEPDESNGGDE